MNRIYCLILLLPALSSCGYFVQKEPEPAAPKLSTNGASLGFASLREAIFQPHCVRCHAHYAAYASVRGEAPAILAAVESNRMPKGGAPLAPELKAALRSWIEAGAPEVPGQAPPAPDPLLPTWSSLSVNVLTPLCVACHNPNGQARFLDLSSFEAVELAKDRTFGAGQKLLDVEDPAASYLLAVLEDEEEPMPPKWSNLRAVTVEERSTIRQWIEAGLPRN